MLKTILFWGVVAGLFVGAVMFATTSAMADRPPPMLVGMLIGYSSMLVALSAVFVGVKRYRDRERGGVIRFWSALGMGLGISVVAGIIYVLAWEATLAVTGMDYAGKFVEQLIAERKAEGVGAAELAKYVAEMEAFKQQYANPVYRMPMTFSEIFPVGVLVSLITAALLRKPEFMPLRRG